MGIHTYLPVIVLLCLAGCLYAQNITCDEELCPGASVNTDEDGNLRDQCCKYIVFVNGCCSEQQNDYLKLIRDIIIGVSVGVAGLIAILILICVCCCCCVCCN